MDGCLSNETNMRGMKYEEKDCDDGDSLIWRNMGAMEALWELAQAVVIVFVGQIIMAFFFLCCLLLLAIYKCICITCTKSD